VLQDEDERIYDLGNQSRSQNGALELGRVGGFSVFNFLILSFFSQVSY